MKKLSIIGAIALVLATSACSKTQEPQSGELVKVTFNVSTLDVYSEPMTKSSVNASDGLTRIDYVIMNNATTKTGTQTIAESPDEFGTIELWLSPGTYTAQIAGFAGDGQLYKSGTDYLLSTYNSDTFFCKETLTIDSGNAYSIKLERLTGQLVIDITDESVSNDIKGYSVEFMPYPTYYIKTGVTTSPSSRITQNINVQDGTFPDFTYFTFQAPIAQELTIKLVASDDSVLGQTIVGYNIYPNKKTIIRGNILDVITQKGLTITYNDEWGTDVIVPLQ